MDYKIDLGWLTKWLSHRRGLTSFWYHRTCGPYFPLAWWIKLVAENLIKDNKFDNSKDIIDKVCEILDNRSKLRDDITCLGINI